MNLYYAVVAVSPRTRGWTLLSSHGRQFHPGFPAHAGMDPADSHGVSGARRFPRARGDGPLDDLLKFADLLVSPRTRGWTRDAAGEKPNLNGFPAHAGMDPRTSSTPGASSRFPRARGDGPWRTKAAKDARMVSPRTRGWTQYWPAFSNRSNGFPAHAGMDPRKNAHLVSCRGFPRARGDGPHDEADWVGGHGVSPRTRGWTRRIALTRGHTAGFPAHAGMDPAWGSSIRRRDRFPRARGDGPSLQVALLLASGVSPRTRGWTHQEARRSGDYAGFPAHAGMDPS